MASQEFAEDRLARKVRIGQLLEIYGALLTERQREYVRLHHSEDMSLAEIAREFGVSRQAIHDAIRQAEAAMEHYEAALGVLAKSTALIEGRPSDDSVASEKDLGSIMEDLDALRHRLASQGIIYDSDEYVRVLEGIIERLRGPRGGTASE